MTSVLLELTGNETYGNIMNNSAIYENVTCLLDAQGGCMIDHDVVCVGDPLYCNLSREEYMELLHDYISPTLPEWILIFSHCLVFFMGLIGNALVVLAVYMNHSMRSVTNIAISNLAIADFFVLLFCLPPTVIWDVTETWFLGETMCKVVIYFQTVSITVSISTLTYISVDRWYAICYPLRYKPQPERAWRWIAVIWTFGLCFDIPELLVLQTTRKALRFDVELFTQCSTTWSAEDEKIFYIVKLILLYTLPLLFMSIAYFQIVRVLWRSDNIPGHRVAGCNRSNATCESNSTTIGQLRARRKAAKMLVAVVIMFAACYFPVHALNIVRYTYTDLDQNELVSVLSLLSHWLCYANSCINPIIYNFMSGKFRREFRNVLEKGHCMKFKRHPCSRHHHQSEYRSRHLNEDQSFINTTSHLMHLTPSIKRNFKQQTWQTSFTTVNGYSGRTIPQHSQPN